MFGEFVELFWVASAFTVGLPLYVLQRLASSETLKHQAAAMTRFVVTTTGMFANLGLLGMFYGYLVDLFT